MYLVSQLASYMFLTFLLGVGVGYALWRAWGEREVIAKFNAAEMQLAKYLSDWEKTSAPGNAPRDTAAPAAPAARPSGERDGERDASLRRMYTVG